MRLAQGHNTVMPVRLKPTAPRSRVKHSTTEPGILLPSMRWLIVYKKHMSKHMVKKLLKFYLYLDRTLVKGAHQKNIFHIVHKNIWLRNHIILSLSRQDFS